MIPSAEPVVPAIEPIPISSSDAEHSDHLAFALLQLVGEVMIAHSFKEGSDSDTSLGEVNMALRFRTLGQKKSKPVANPPAESIPLLSQELLLTPAQVLTLIVEEEAELNLLKEPLLDKQKGKQLIGPPLRSLKRRRGKRVWLSSLPLVLRSSSKSLNSPSSSSANK